MIERQERAASLERGELGDHELARRAREDRDDAFGLDAERDQAMRVTRATRRSST